MSSKFKIKVSKDATFEEMATAFKEATGNPDFMLSQEVYGEFVSLNESESEEREMIIKIMGKYYDELKDKTDKESIKRKDELMDIARFILFLKEDVKLISMGESPDFIIEINGEQIGIEHTRVYDKALVAMISNLEKVCKDVQQALSLKAPDAKKIFNIQFNYDKISQIDRKSLVPILLEYLFNYLSDQAIDNPEIVKKISVSSHSTLEIVLSEEYLSKGIATKDLDVLISQKEQKLKKYEANCGLKNIYLLVIVDGVSEKSDHDLSPELLPQREFSFNNIFVFNPFKNVCVSTKFGRDS
ncbi:MAG: hypothetical protein J0L56_01705 [Chitinophagales bacterium]|nr:hypothetical protein [Chitinophagales bacterium]